MNLQRIILWKSPWRCFLRFSSSTNMNEVSLRCLSAQLDINLNVVQHLAMKHPVINKLNKDNINNLLQTLHEIGFSKDILIEEPQLFGVLPITLKYRYQVLKECCIKQIHPKYLTNYLNIVRQKTVGELKKAGLILSHVNVENKLASYMSQWPTSLTSYITEDMNQSTLYKLRLKIIQRYLELVLDMTHEQFYRGIETYPTIKHRPLTYINETLTILQSVIMIPTQKIKNNMYLLHADPDNLSNIVFKLQYLGGIDVKDVIRRHPKIAMKNYKTLTEILNIFKEYNINDEAQRRCFDIFTLSSSTIKERLEKAKGIPEFQTYYDHPRFLKMIHYNNTAHKRLQKLYNTNKKCLSLNILSGSSAHYEMFEKAPGDRLGKGKDLIFCISQSLGKKYRKTNIQNKIKRHPFWINIPLVQVKHVYQNLSDMFAPEDIYENCPILLYPWSKVRDTLKLLETQGQFENVDLKTLNNTKKLSLVLYALEKHHYFTGNGVWIEERNKNG